MDVRFLIPPWERVEKTLGCPDPSGMRRPLAHVFALADSSKALLAVEEEGASPGQTQPTAPLFNVWFSGAWGATALRRDLLAAKNVQLPLKRVHVELLAVGGPGDITEADIGALLGEHRSVLFAGVDNVGNTVLHWAVARGGGCDILVPFLVEMAADLDHQNKAGKTPLHIAARAKCRKCFSLLLKQGADLCVEDKQRLTPFHVLCSQGKEGLNILRSVFEASSDRERQRILDLKTSSDWSMSLLHKAAQMGSEIVCEFLLNNRPAMIHDQTEIVGHTPLHIAASNHHPGTVGMLAKLLPGGGDSANLQQTTPLMLVFWVHHAEKSVLAERVLETCRILVEGHGARPGRRNLAGCSALHYAATCSWPGSGRCVEYLLRHGADPTVRCDEIKVGPEGKKMLNLTPRQVAKESGLDDIASLLEKAEKSWMDRKRRVLAEEETPDKAQNHDAGVAICHHGEQEEGEVVVDEEEEDEEDDPPGKENASSSSSSSSIGAIGGGVSEAAEAGGGGRTEAEDAMIREFAFEAVREAMEKLDWQT